MLNIKQLKYRSYFLIVMFIGVAFSLIFFTLSHIRQSGLNQVKESLTTLLSTVQEAHHIWIDQRLKGAHEYASRQDIVTLSEQLVARYQQGGAIIGSQPLAELRRTIEVYLTKNNDQGFFLIAPDHISIGSMRDRNINTTNLISQQKTHQLEQSFQGKTVFIHTIVSDAPLVNGPSHGFNPPTMFIVTPIKSQNGDVIAVLAFRINPAQHFTRITQLGRFGMSGETYAFDERGILITNSRFDDDLRFAGLIGSNESPILNIKITDPGGNLLTGYRSKGKAQALPLTLMAKSATAGHKGVNLDGYRDYRGVTVIGAWLWDKSYHFGLTSEIDLGEALIPYYNMRRALFVVVALLCLLGFILISFIRRMDKASSRGLKEAYSSLEARVTERTLELEVTQRQLSKANSELTELANTDGLTGLYNRRHFDELYATEWRRCLREQKQVAIIFFDVDFFKAYNDFYGHQQGDDCLKKIGLQLQQMRSADRPGDFVARYGGEEFTICLSDTTEAYAQEVAMNVLHCIAELKLPHEKSEVDNIDYITVSVGVAIDVARLGNSAEKLLEKADKAQYMAKGKGRNQVCVFDAKI
jgi:diguanylate cyclase (GGDEF)-like protein